MTGRAATLTRAFVAAVAARDAEGVAACLSRDARLRAVRPRGVVRRSGRDAVATQVVDWLPPGSSAEVAELTLGPAGDRLSLAFDLDVAVGPTRHHLQQRGFVTVDEQGITAVDVVCTGLWPPPSRPPLVTQAG